MKPIMIVGKGHLGRFLKKRFDVPDELFWTEDMMSLDRDKIVNAGASVVINTAGKTDLTWCEDNAKECFRSNVECPIHLYNQINCIGYKCIFIHISSGCVWDGPFRPDGKPFHPWDTPSPACFYSWTKVACDSILMRNVDQPIVILRPRQVYSGDPSPRNALSKLRQYKALLDTPNSMTSAETIAKTIESSIGTGIRNRIINVYDAGIASPYRVGVKLAEAGLRDMPEMMQKSELDAWHKPKRVDAVIYDPDFEAEVRPPQVMDEVQRMIGLYKVAVSNGGTNV